jgi:polysaccharide pyruvyl transferase WcaK-like protein
MNTKLDREPRDRASAVVEHNDRRQPSAKTAVWQATRNAQPDARRHKTPTRLLMVNPSALTSSMDPEIKSICLLGQGFGNNNLGVHALTTGTVSSALNALPQARLWLLDYDDFPTAYEVHVADRVVTLAMVNMRFSKKLFLSNNIAMLVFLAFVGRTIPFAGLRKKFFLSNYYLRQLQESDIVAALGGGDSFSDIYGQERLWYVSLPQILALLMNRPLVLLPQTIGPFKTAIGRSVARLILRHARRIYTRDTESLGEVERLLGHRSSRAAFAYDMGFALDPLPPPGEVKEQIEKLRRQGELVGLNVSGLLYAGGYTGANQFGLRVDYREMVRRLIEFLVERQGVQVLLVPHVLGGPGALESDITACDRVFETLEGRCHGRLHRLPGTLDHHQTKWVIGQSDFFLGSRMHACIAALSQAVPALGLAYSRKFAGVFDSMGAADLVVDLTRQDAAGALSLVGARFQQRRELKQRLESAAPKLRQSVLNLFREIGRNGANRSNGA